MAQVTDTQRGVTKYTYDTNNLVKTITSPGGEVVTYTYDDYNNIIQASSSVGVTTTYTYDEYGNLKTTTVGGTITTTNTYSSNGNLLESTKNAANKTTYYSYDANTGELDSVQYPNDTTSTKTNYTYDSMHRLKDVTATVTGGASTLSMSAGYDYTNDYLTSITTGSTTYGFSYGNFGLRSKVTAGSYTLASYGYTSRTHYLDTLKYGNGQGVAYSYNTHGDVTEQTYYSDFDNKKVDSTVTYKYNNSGYLASTTDSGSGITTTYYYDLSDRLTKYSEKSSSYSHVADYEYDNSGNLTNLFDTILGSTYKSYYYYDAANRISKVYDGGVQETYDYDSAGRLTKRIANISATTHVLTDTLAYESGTGRVSSLNTTSRGNYNVTHAYIYDANGNITDDVSRGKTTHYEYDSANQLVRENNKTADKTWVWTYDNAGNILSRKEYDYTTADTLGTADSTISYVYDDADGWGDLLTSYNGHTVESDRIGNITRVSTAAGTDYRRYTWKHGRQLASSYYNSATWTYSYNADGMRYKRTSGNAAYTYYYNGDLLRYLDYDSNTTDSSAAAKLYFVLDATGKPIEVSYRPEGSSTTSFYYYVHNLQGDVEALVDYSTGNAVVWYTYDAWGNVLSENYTTGYEALARLNPFRYRSYVYDRETKLYYLQSRYYDPEMGRFINADALASTGQGLLGNNMFAYCNNSPVVHKDTTGEGIETVFDVVSLAASAVEVLSNPTDLSAWVSLVGDTVDLIPFVTGVGETIRALKVADKITDGADTVIDTYRRLKKAGGEAGEEVHHIVEKRFANLFGYGKRGGSMPSISLSSDEHRVLTNLWRNAIPYGSDYTVAKVIKAAAEVYSDNPQLMGAAIYTMIRNVKQ